MRHGGFGLLIVKSNIAISCTDVMNLCGRKAGGLHEKVLRISGSTNYGDLIQEILSE